MNSTYKLLIKQINDGKNLEEAIPQLFEALSESYQQYALYQLCLHYYDLASVAVNNKKGATDVEEILESLQVMFEQMIHDNNFSTHQPAFTEKLNTLRNDIIDKMDVLTMYTDKLSVYEYILNRKELEFVDEYEEVDEEQFVQSAVRYIFGSKDNYVINEAIKEVISQLPVRMTKSKYFDVLRESLASFKGGNMASLDTYLYMIKTCAMLYHSNQEDCCYSNLKEIVDVLAATDYKNLDKESYEKLCKSLRDGAEYIAEVTDFLMILQQVVNNLYVYLLTSPYTKTGKDIAICKKILNLVHSNFETGFDLVAEEQYIALVSEIEGKQEELFESCQLLLVGFHTIYDGYESIVEELNELGVANALKLAEQLSDTSAFIDFRKVIDDTEVNPEVLSNVAEELIDEMSTLFKQNGQTVNRAIMANTLDKLPVFFNNTEEVISYITTAVQLCSNKEEKTASMRLVLSMIEENSAWSKS